MHSAFGDSNAVDNLGGVFGFDLVLSADGHQVCGFGIVYGVHIGLLPDTAIDCGFLGYDLTECVLPVAATTARFARSRRLGLLAQQVGGNILVGSIASNLVLLLEGVEVCLGEDEGIPDVLLGVDEVVLARQALVRRDVTLEQQPCLFLLDVGELLVGL